jgi:DNA-binding MarR family transcriptional regulator
MAVRRRNSALEVLELFRRALPQPTITDLTVLFYVAENPGINIAELADVSHTTLATASRVSRAFASPEADGALPPYLGLIELKPNPHYAKGRLLYLTEAGKALIDEADKIIGEAIRVYP